MVNSDWIRGHPALITSLFRAERNAMPHRAQRCSMQNLKSFRTACWANQRSCRAECKHSQVHRCVRTASPSQAKRIKWFKWFRITPTRTTLLRASLFSLAAERNELVQVARAVHQHSPSHCCSHLPSHSQTKRFNRLNVF